MTTFALVLSAFCVTLVMSLILPQVVKPLLIRLKIMDVPNERSSHTRPVIRGVGLAVLIAMAIGFAFNVIVMVTVDDLSVTPTATSTLVVVGLAATASGLLGLSEDLRGVSVAVRSVLLLVIAGATAVVLVNPQILGREASFGWGAPFDRINLPLWIQAVLVFYAVLFISSYINVANFMDGLNGISGFHGIIAGVTFAVIGQVTGLTWLAIAGVVLAAGYLGFLPYNLTKPGAFLGDVGSYLLGGAVAATSFAALMAGVPVLATIGPMVIYFGDVGVTLVKRVRRGHKWDEPHKEHVYQRIEQLGFSHTAASGITAVCTLATSVLGFVSLYVPGWPQLFLLAGGFVVFGIYLALPRLISRRLE